MHVERPDLSPPEGRDFFTSETMDKVTFSRSQVGKIFFARGHSWMIAQLLKKPELDGQLLEFTKGKNGYYQFKLYDVERLAHYFLYSQVINFKQFERTIQLVKLIAANYHMI